MTMMRRPAEAGTALARTARTMRCASASDRARISPVFSSRLAGFPLPCDPRTRGLYQILNARLGSPPSSPSSRAPTMSPHGICMHHGIIRSTTTRPSGDAVVSVTVGPAAVLAHLQIYLTASGAVTRAATASLSPGTGNA